MNRQDFKILAEKLVNVENYINSQVQKAKYKDMLKQFKSYSDKQFMYAYYNQKYNVANEKLLLEELKTNQKNKMSQTIMFVFIKDISKLYYNDNDKAVNIMEQVKEQLRQNMSENLIPLLMSEDYYFYNDAIMFYCDSTKAQKLYKRVRAIFKKIDYDFIVKYVVLNSDITKPLKKLDDAYGKALKMLKEQESEAE